MPNRVPAHELKSPALARILKISARTLYNLRAEGIPHRWDGNLPLYPMPEALDWYYRRKLAQEPANDPANDPASGTLTAVEAERRIRVAEMERKEIEVGRLRGHLVTIDDHEAEVTDLVQRLRGIILRHPKLRPIADEILAELLEEAPPELGEADADEPEPEPAAVA